MDGWDASVTNLEGMTEAELRQLIRQAEQALQQQIAKRARSTLKEIRHLAAEVGFEVSFTNTGKAVGSKGNAFVPRGKAVQNIAIPIIQRRHGRAAGDRRSGCL